MSILPIVARAVQEEILLPFSLRMAGLIDEANRIAIVADRSQAQRLQEMEQQRAEATGRTIRRLEVVTQNWRMEEGYLRCWMMIAGASAHLAKEAIAAAQRTLTT